MSMQMEELSGVLWMTGNLHPNEESVFVQRLAKYFSTGINKPRVLEMSAVGYLPSSAAKALVSQAQQATGKITIRGSVPVVRTLKSFRIPESIEIEAYREPNKKSVSAAEVRPVTRRATARILAGKDKPMTINILPACRWTVPSVYL